jgi:hypothetical protein
MRKLRNNIIRSQSGVAGLQQFRRLNKIKQQMLPALYRMRRELFEMERTTGGGPFTRLRRWWQVRQTRKQLERLREGFTAAAVQQALLINPRLGIRS